MGGEITKFAATVTFYQTHDITDFQVMTRPQPTNAILKEIGKLVGAGDQQGGGNQYDQSPFGPKIFNYQIQQQGIEWSGIFGPGHEHPKPVPSLGSKSVEI
mgnify:CR=1 FL=1